MRALAPLALVLLLCACGGANGPAASNDPAPNAADVTQEPTSSSMTLIRLGVVRRIDQGHHGNFAPVPPERTGDALKRAETWVNAGREQTAVWNEVAGPAIRKHALLLDRYIAGAKDLPLSVRQEREDELVKAAHLEATKAMADYDRR